MDLDLHPIFRVNIQSLDQDPVLQSERMIDEVNLNLQEEMTDADIDHDQGAVPSWRFRLTSSIILSRSTPGLRDPHHV